MNIAIAGFDTEGRSSYAYFANQLDEHSRPLHRLTVLDQNIGLNVPDGVDSVLGADYLHDLNRFDMIVRTAGLPPRLLYEHNPELPPEKVTSQTNEFFRVAPTGSIIGVTGTKGKGTTSTLITRMLQAAGRSVHLAGNIGVPALELLPSLDAGSWVVLELSSFQLIDLRQSPQLAVCLMVVPEHLNWHADMAEYLTAKSQLFAHQGAGDTAIYYMDNSNSRQIAGAGGGRLLPYYAAPGAAVDDEGYIVISGNRVCHTGELRLLGHHNWQNACAAVTAAWTALMTGTAESAETAPHHIQDAAPVVTAMRQVLTSFSGLPHRLELVRELDGVRYYDDSFGTTPETAIVAVQAFDQPKVVILGGSDKGASYDELARAVNAGNVRRALLIGDQAERIGNALQAAGFMDFQAGGDTMQQIVANARTAARPGYVVLLSTGCASFGMFRDYKDRGDQFKACVTSLDPQNTASGL